MKEDFVSFDLAKKLKEKGYPQKPDHLSRMPYYEYDEVANYTALCNEIVWHMSTEPRKNIFAAPAIYKVLKWLREEKKIHIIIDICNGNWEYSIKEKIRLNELLQYISQTTPVPICRSSSYEEAAIAGIEYCLDNLI